MQRATANPFTVLEYCNAMKRGEITINRKYQRNDSIWPESAKSFLIETILLGYEMPKFYLYPITDVKTRTTIKEIVDGQQRSSSINEFFTNKLRLSPKLDTEEVAGKTYEELDEEYQQAFLNYSLSVDMFLSGTPEDIREVFRRLNSYNVPANPEEQRHAKYQGRFKWFIAGLSKDLGKIFADTGVFTEKALVRMADCKLLTEIAHALKHGISTTNKARLNGIYREFDKAFPDEKDLRTQVGDAFSQVVEWTELHSGPLMKPYNIYSLVLAILHIRHRFPKLTPVFALERKKATFHPHAVQRLTELADAITDEALEGEDKDFVKACSEKTNVKAERETRFQYFCRALSL